MKQISHYCEYHLGDCVYHLHYLRLLVHDKDVCITFYVQPQYIDELQNHIIGYEDKIKLGSLYNTPTDALNCHMNCNRFWSNYCDKYYNGQRDGVKADISKFWPKWFNYFSKKMGMESPIVETEDMLSDYPALLETNKLTDKVDVLIINSLPMSGQYEYEEDEFRRVIRECTEKGMRVVVTKHIDDVECTLDYNFNLIQIGSIAISAKKIIAVNTSPIILSINKYNTNTKVVALDKYIDYSYSNVTSICSLKQLVI